MIRQIRMLASVALSLFQIAAWLRTLARIGRLPEIAPLHAVAAAGPADITIVVPVLNEAARLTPLLECLMRSRGDVATILIVDGGSEDGTQDLIRTFHAHDDRLRLIEASAPHAGWNGKAWNMQAGLDRTVTPYVLFLDADVVVQPYTSSTLRRAVIDEHLAALSVATTQRCFGFFSTALHAALLTTFVYRHGIPGRRARTVAEATANGQVYFAETAALRESDAIAHAKDARCDDLKLTEALLAHGYATAFVELADGAEVCMYTSLAEIAENWPRSLGLLHDGNRGRALGRLADVAAVQVFPLLLTLARPRSALLRFINIVLLLQRFGFLAGMARVYEKRSVGYWLSPLADLPAVCLILAHALKPDAQWRGRALVRNRR